MTRGTDRVLCGRRRCAGGAGGWPTSARRRKVYRELAGRRSGEEREILLAIADAEERHAAHWEQLLGADVGPVRRGNLRSRVLAFLARRFGSVFVLALAQRAETPLALRRPTSTPPGAMAADERVHEEVVRGLAARGRARVSGTFRAAVFGANDGLVSNLALVLGVSGGGASTATVLLTGLAGLLSGALSMGAGEYVSVRSQRELLAASTPDIADAHTVLPTSTSTPTSWPWSTGPAACRPTRRSGGPTRCCAATTPSGSVDPGARDSERARRRRHRAGRRAVQLRVLRHRCRGPGAAVPVRAGRDRGAGHRSGAGRPRADAHRRHRRRAVGGPPLRRALRQLAIGAGAAAVTYGLGLLFGATVG